MSIKFDLSLEEVKGLTKRAMMAMIPTKGTYKPESSWLMTNESAIEAVKKVLGKSTYSACAGVVTALNGVYWIKVLGREQDGLVVRNLAEIGRKKVKEVTTIVESELIYPHIRGRDVKKWFCHPLGHILVPCEVNGKTMSVSQLKVHYPRTYSYFNHFFKDLVMRGGQPYKSKLKAYREKPRGEAEKVAPPFYWLFNVGSSLAQYKVAWKEIAGKISGKGEFSVAVISPYTDRWVGTKSIVADHKLMFIPFDDEDEAYFVAAVLNSSVARAIVAGYTIETGMDTHIIKNIKVPIYNANDPVHTKLVELSKAAHKAAIQGIEDNLTKIEDEVDEVVAQLYGLTSEELIKIKESLKILKGEDIETEEAKREILEETKPEKAPKRALESLLKKFKEE